jgi:hypothetical protein
MISFPVNAPKQGCQIAQLQKRGSAPHGDGVRAKVDIKAKTFIERANPP